MSTQQKSIGVRSPPAYIFPGAWALCDQLLLCDLVLFELDRYDPEINVVDMVIDYGKIARKIRRYAMSDSRSKETAKSCFLQLSHLALSIARATGVTHADPYSLVYRAGLTMRQVRVSELAISITMCKDRLRIYAADRDSLAGHPVNAKLLDASSSYVPMGRPRTFVYYESVNSEGLGSITKLSDFTLPSNWNSTGAGSIQKRFFLVPQRQDGDETRDTTKTLTTLPVIPGETVPPELPVPLLKSTLTVFRPASSTPIVVYSIPRAHNRSILYLIMSTLTTHTQAGPFLHPVDESIAPKYSQFVHHPMDFKTIAAKLDAGLVPHCFALFELISLVFHNCYLYNAKNSDVWLMALDLDTFATSLFQGTYPEYAEIFGVSLIDGKKTNRKPKQSKNAFLVNMSIPLPKPNSESVLGHQSSEGSSENDTGAGDVEQENRSDSQQNSSMTDSSQPSNTHGFQSTKNTNDIHDNFTSRTISREKTTNMPKNNSMEDMDQDSTDFQDMENEDDESEQRNRDDDDDEAEDENQTDDSSPEDNEDEASYDSENDEAAKSVDESDSNRNEYEDGSNEMDDQRDDEIEDDEDASDISQKRTLTRSRRNF